MNNWNMADAQSLGMAVCVFLFATGLAMLLSAWRHHRAAASRFHGTVWVEMSWALVPVLMVALLVWPAAKAAWLL